MKKIIENHKKEQFKLRYCQTYVTDNTIHDCDVIWLNTIQYRKAGFVFVNPAHIGREMLN